MTDRITTLFIPLMIIRIILITNSNADTSNNNEQYSKEGLNTRAAALRAAYDEQQ